MANRDPRYFKVYQDGDDRELEQRIQDILESGAAPGIDTVAREGVEEIQRMIENGEIGGGGGGSGVDPKAREDIQKITTELTGTVKEINGVKPVNGKVTLPALEVDTTNLATKTEVLTKRDKTTPLMLADLHTEVKTAMTGGSVPVVGIGAVGNENIKRQTVDYTQVNFIKESSNIVNRFDMTPGTSLNPTTGEPVVNQYNSLTDFTKIKPSQAYIANNVSRWGFYDINKVFISGGTATTFTSPANAYYARFVVGNGLYNPQVNEGTTLLAYEDNYRQVDGSIQKGLTVPVSPYSVKEGDLRENAVTPVNVNFIKNPKNLFNKDYVTTDKKLDIVGTIGELITDTTYVTSSGFIKVRPNAAYAKNASAIVVYYDKFKSLSGYAAIGSGTVSFTTPPNAEYLKMSVTKTSLATFMLNEGTTSLPYEPHMYELQSTQEYPLVIPSGGGGNEQSKFVQPFNTPFEHKKTSSALAAGASDNVCDISSNCYIQSIEFSGNTKLGEMQIQVRKADGSLENYQLMKNDGSGYVPITFENIVTHGSNEFLFSDYDTTTNVYKVHFKDRQFAKGLVVKIRNGDTTAKNLTCRVVGGTYA